jgi:hypothetical protein
MNVKMLLNYFYVGIIPYPVIDQNTADADNSGTFQFNCLFN